MRQEELGLGSLWDDGSGPFCGGSASPRPAGRALPTEDGMGSQVGGGSDLGFEFFVRLFLCDFCFDFDGSGCFGEL